MSLKIRPDFAFGQSPVILYQREREIQILNSNNFILFKTLFKIIQLKPPPISVPFLFPLPCTLIVDHF